MNKAFHNKENNDGYVLQNSLSSIKSDVNANTVKKLLNGKVNSRDYFKPLSTNKVFPYTYKLQDIKNCNYPIFVSKKDNIIGVIPFAQYRKNRDIKLKLLYSPLTYFDNFDDVSITSLQNSFAIVKDKGKFYYSSKEMIINNLLFNKS